MYVAGDYLLACLDIPSSNAGVGVRWGDAPNMPGVCHTAVGQKTGCRKGGAKTTIVGKIFVNEAMDLIAVHFKNTNSSSNF